MINAKQYAKALHGGSVDSGFINGFLELVKARGHVRLLPRILLEFEKLEQVSDGDGSVSVTVAREGDLEKLKSDIRMRVKELGVAEGDVVTEVDEKVVGGFIVKGRDTLIDMSHRSMLIGLYKKLVN